MTFTITVDQKLISNYLISFSVKNNQSFVKILNREIMFNPNFHMYFITRKSIPSFAPSIYSLTTVIDFDITEESLQNELFTVVTKSLNPELGDRRTSTRSNGRLIAEQLKTMEESFLNMIASTDGPLLDSIDIIDRVESTKSAIVSLRTELVEVVRCVESIEVERQNYYLLVKRAASLFIALTEMAHVNVFYQYSLTSFIGIFIDVMRELVDHIADESNLHSQICSALTKRIYNFGVVGMIGQDKILFALQMAIKCELCDGDLEQEPVNFLIEPTAAASSTASPFEWLTNQQWTNFNAFDQRFSTIAGIASHFEANEQNWRKWYLSEKPEAIDVPGGFFPSDNFMVMST